MQLSSRWASLSLFMDFFALTTADMRCIRKKLNLTQKQAGEMFGGGHNAFSHYKSGSARPPKSTDTRLRLLDSHPDLLNEIPKGKAA